MGQTVFKSYKSRPSKRKGKSPSTIPDTVVSLIFHQLHHNLTDENIKNAAYSHSTMMTIENIVGDMLEEFLSIKLQQKGWACCWGKTIRAVDFCHSDGTLLQVKTSDNSENSSSSDIRSGTRISKWCRRKSKKREDYYWGEIQKITGISTLNEKEFRDFIHATLEENPNCLYKEENSET